MKRSVHIPLLLLLTGTAAHAQQASAPTMQDNQQSNANAANRVQRHQIGGGGQARHVVVHVMRYLPFSDVPKDHWAYQSVENLRKAGIVLGYPSQHPAPRFTRQLRLDNIRQGRPANAPAAR